MAGKIDKVNSTVSSSSSESDEERTFTKSSKDGENAAAFADHNQEFEHILNESQTLSDAAAARQEQFDPTKDLGAGNTDGRRGGDNANPMSKANMQKAGPSKAMLLSQINALGAANEEIRTLAEDARRNYERRMDEMRKESEENTERLIQERIDQAMEMFKKSLAIENQDTAIDQSMNSLGESSNRSGIVTTTTQKHPAGELAKQTAIKPPERLSGQPTGYLPSSATEQSTHQPAGRSMDEENPTAARMQRPIDSETAAYTIHRNRRANGTDAHRRNAEQHRLPNISNSSERAAAGYNVQHNRTHEYRGEQFTNYQMPPPGQLIGGYGMGQSNPGRQRDHPAYTGDDRHYYPMAGQQYRDERPFKTLNHEAIGKTIIEKITKYSGNNYEEWSDEVEKIFVMDNRVQHLERDMPKEYPYDKYIESEDLRLAAFLRANVDTKYKYLIDINGVYTTVYEIWDALRKRHEHEQKNKIEESVMKLVSIGAEGPRHNTLLPYLDLMMAIVADLRRRRATVDDIVTTIIMCGIPKGWNYMKSYVKTFEGTCEQKINRIRMMHDAPSGKGGYRQNNTNASSAAPKVMNIDSTQAAAKAGRKNRKQRDQSGSDSGEDASDKMRFKASKKMEERIKNSNCGICGRKGHWKATCRFKDGVVAAACDDCYEAASPRPSEDEDNESIAGAVVEYTSSEEYDTDSEPEVTGHVVNNLDAAQSMRDRWVFDTGSSIHLANDLRWFIKYKPIKAKFGTSDSSTSIVARAVGTVKFRLRCGREFTVDRVFYCPTARMNLLTNQGLRDEFSFTVTPDRTTANYTDSRTGKAQSFEFAAVQKKQNVICVDPEQESVLATTTRQASKQATGASATPRQEPTGTVTEQPTTKPKRGRPKKCPPSVQPVENAAQHATLPSGPSGRSLDKSAVRESEPPIGPERAPAAEQKDGQCADRESDAAHQKRESNRQVDLREWAPIDDLSGDSDVEEEKAQARELYPQKLKDQFRKLAHANKIRDGKDVHRAHGHIGETATKRMSVLYDVPCPLFDCEPCREFNLNHEVNRRPTIRTSSRPLEVVYLDVCQPYPRTVESYDGTKLALMVLDDYTGYAKVFSMKTKDEAFACFVHYKTRAECRHPNCKIDEIRTDNGKEFDNSQFADLKEKTGFKHRFSVAHIHEMAGKIERLNRTLEEKCKKLMAFSGLPTYYWPLAMRHAVRLFNNTANPRNGVPYFNWHQNIDDRRAFEFGERVVYLYYDGRGEMQRSNGRVVGHDDDSKSVQVIPKGTNKVVKRIYFFKPLHRYPDSPVAPIEFGSTYEQRMDQEAVQFNEFALHVFESREWRMLDQPDDGHLGELDEFVLQVSADGVCDPSTPVPGRYSDIRKLPIGDQEYWMDCVAAELNTLVEKKVFRPVPRSEAKTKPIGTQYVFTRKETGKARMVARGDLQDTRTFSDTYSPTTNVEVLRLLLKIALEKDLDVFTFDVKRAYLNARLEDDVYLELPQGYNLIDPNLDRREWVLELNKALYGLKQSGRLWYLEITDKLKKIGFVPFEREPTLFVHRGRGIYLAVYVDDLVVAAPGEGEIDFVRQSLLKFYELHDNGRISRILGLNVEKTKDGYAIHLQDMIEETAKQYSVEPDDRVLTPLPANSMIEPHENAVAVEYEEYAAIIGSLLYIARMARPDVLSAVVQLCQFQADPKTYHMRRAKRILTYLIRSKCVKYHIRKSGSLELVVYSDSSLANLFDRKSLMGCAVFIGGAMIGYTSKKCRMVTLSSNEAEIVSGLASAKDLLYFKKLLCEVLHGVQIDGRARSCSECETPTLLVDNSGVLSFAEKGFTRRTRYLDIEFYGLKFYADRKEYQLRYVRSEDNRSDLFTKSLPVDTLRTQCDLVGLA